MPPQMIPHMPQLFLSVWRSTQVAPQRKSPGLHWHCWVTQLSVAAQDLGQEPQCWTLAVMSTHPLPQSSVP